MHVKTARVNGPLVWTELVEDVEEFDGDDELEDEDLEDTEEEDNLRHLPLYGKTSCVLFLAV